MESLLTWNHLEESYREKGLVLVLGAGVSLQCGLPSWEDLLKKLAARCFGAKGGLLFDELRELGYDLPAIAGMIQNSSPSDQKYSELVREALYEEFPFFQGGIDKNNRDEFILYVQTRNPTMRAVASLCARGDAEGKHYTINPLIHGVVTLNVDSVLQAFSYARYKARLLHTVGRPAAETRPDKINTYHMHGYLRFGKGMGDLAKEAPDALVFTEQEYFDFFNRPNSLFNYTFLYLLREYLCLFVGLSMQDDNIRRLLHYSAIERAQGFKITGRGGADGKKSLRHVAILKKFHVPEVADQVEESLSHLGTRVGWVEDYAEIPDRLAAMYRSGGGNWETVF